jgi:hypothetical protein
MKENKVLRLERIEQEQTELTERYFPSLPLFSSVSNPEWSRPDVNRNRNFEQKQTKITKREISVHFVSSCLD